ncbi:uncharacterized protein LOC116298917 [Actinia tenebrosa]|uniref:Uncharacterized protein LOC116298917 n=1 Tax=Actinia tenebrosa TaxID=6105 RepID=A0A6P8I7X0_ACTTE|nr:uncharacterized protein LOC116298917 [Actinia tenebrosa]
MRDAAIDHLSATSLKASSLLTPWLYKTQDVLCNMRDAAMDHLSATSLKASSSLTSWFHKLQNDLMDLSTAAGMKAAKYDYFWLYKIRDCLVVLFRLLATMDKTATARNIAYAVVSCKVFCFCFTFLGVMDDAATGRRHRDRSIEEMDNKLAGNTQQHNNWKNNNRRNNKKQQKRRNRNRK